MKKKREKNRSADLLHIFHSPQGLRTKSFKDYINHFIVTAFCQNKSK